MPSSVKKTFALLLLATALLPVAMWMFHQQDPAGLFEAYRNTSYFAGNALFYGAWLLAALILLYPPFLPYVRLHGGEMFQRLGTDRGPIYEGIAKLRHLETHAERFKVGRLARQVGDVNLAAENLGRAYELDPSHISGRYELGLLLAQTGDIGNAAQFLASVIQEDERHAFGDALFQYGQLAFRAHQDAAAIQTMRRHQELFPGSREVHLILARALCDSGDMDAARQELAAARRPPGEGEHLSRREQLARAKARVTMLRKRNAPPREASLEEDNP